MCVCVCVSNVSQSHTYECHLFPQWTILTIFRRLNPQKSRTHPQKSPTILQHKYMSYAAFVPNESGRLWFSSTDPFWVRWASSVERVCSELNPTKSPTNPHMSTMNLQRKWMSYVVFVFRNWPVFSSISKLCGESACEVELGGGEAWKRALSRKNKRMGGEGGLFF